MKFSEALEHLKAGKYIYRKVWPESIHLRMIDGTIVTYREEIIPYNYDNDIILCNDWVISGNNKFSFCEAMEMLKMGMKVKLPEWKESYLISDPFNNNIFFHNMCRFEWTPTFKCFLENDWEIIECTI